MRALVANRVAREAVIDVIRRCHKLAPSVRLSDGSVSAMGMFRQLRQVLLGLSDARSGNLAWAVLNPCSYLGNLARNGTMTILHAKENETSQTAAKPMAHTR